MFEKLSELGFSKGEVKVYVCLLKHGTLTRTGITKHTEVSSSKVYEIADRLVLKGVVSCMLKDNIRYYTAFEITALKRYIEKKQESLEEQKKICDEIASTITMKNDEYFLVYDGWEGIKNAELEAIRECPKNSVIIGIGSQLPKIDFQKEYHHIRNSKNIKVKSFIPEKYVMPVNYKNFSVKVFKNAADMGIGVYPDRVTLESYKEPMVLVIKQPQMVQLIKLMLETMWKNI
jgi:sugar-specific transcriptional regulator TrmB